ncbi:MAG: hypothetical protein NZ933_04935 [Bacteroidia bacterium]|nr:hypothetical protein [Bacteroidia bacterium]
MCSKDLQKWFCDTSFCVGRDVREPRWLIWKDSLYLYFFIGSKRSWRFDSKGIVGMVKVMEGRWDTFHVGWVG